MNSYMEGQVETSFYEWIVKLRKEGYGDKYIKVLETNPHKVMQLSDEERYKLLGRLREMFGEEEKRVVIQSVQNVQNAEKEPQKTVLIQSMLNECICNALIENNKVLIQEIEERVTLRVMKEMNLLLKEREAREEDRFRRIDMIIRDKQKKKLPDWQK